MHARLAQLRRFEHFKVPKWLRLLRPTPKGRHYSGIGGTGPAGFFGGGRAGNSRFSFFSKRLSSGSGSVYRGGSRSRSSVVGRGNSCIFIGVKVYRTV